MSYAELVDIRSRIDVLIAQKRDQERAELRQRIAKIAQEHGFDLREVLGASGKKAVLPKYRDPKNPKNTWSGRGRAPRWITSSTKPKDSFLIG